MKHRIMHSSNSVPPTTWLDIALQRAHVIAHPDLINLNPGDLLEFRDLGWAISTYPYLVEIATMSGVVCVLLGFKDLEPDRNHLGIVAGGAYVLYGGRVTLGNILYFKPYGAED